jgi:HKD family nuclease
MSNRFVQNASTQGFAFKHNIISAIANAHSVDIAVSYLKMTGWYMLSAALKKISPVRIRVLTTDQMNVTQPAVLSAALQSGIQIKCYCGNRVYHPKVYLLHGVAKNKDIAILGSANISGSGLQSGIEAGIQISDSILFRRLAKWFDALFCDPAAREIDERFIKEYEERWEPAARARVPLRRASKVRRRRNIAPTPEDLETLDDAFSTIILPVGTLGFDQAANNIRNLSRLLEVIGRYPDIGSKERSELRLLGFMQSGRLSALGSKARGCGTTAAVAKLWSSWLKKTPNAALNSINKRLASFKRAVTRFWRLKPEVRNFFLRELSNPAERKTLQAIELCCNGSEVVESFLINDFRAMAPFMLRGKKLSAFIRHAVADYLDNKGSRSWKTDDRRIVLNSWR